MNWNDIHPAVNACLNATSAVLLFAGWRAIKSGARELHRKLMLGAFTCSTVFLVSYLARYALTGTHRYPGDGWDKVFYLVILLSHMVLATVMVPMILRLLQLAFRGDFKSHRRIARVVWPMWMYVSITGVVVYLMLYPIAGALYG